MNFLVQVVGMLVALAPLAIAVVVWRLVWNKRSGPSSDPPSGGGPRRRPVPPMPKLSGDRGARAFYTRRTDPRVKRKV